MRDDRREKGGRGKDWMGVGLFVLIFSSFLFFYPFFLLSIAVSTTYKVAARAKTSVCRVNYAHRCKLTPSCPSHISRALLIALHSFLFLLFSFFFLIDYFCK